MVEQIFLSPQVKPWIKRSVIISNIVCTLLQLVEPPTKFFKNGGGGGLARISGFGGKLRGRRGGGWAGGGCSCYIKNKNKLNLKYSTIKKYINKNVFLSHDQKFKLGNFSKELLVRG